MTRPGVNKVKPKGWFSFIIGLVDFHLYWNNSKICQNFKRWWCKRYVLEVFAIHLVLSCTEFVYPGTWMFSFWTSQIDNILFEHGRLLYVLPLAVPQTSFGWMNRGYHSKMFLIFEFFCGTPPSCLKVRGWVVVVGGGGWPTAF